MRYLSLVDSLSSLSRSKDSSHISPSSSPDATAGGVASNMSSAPSSSLLASRRSSSLRPLLIEGMSQLLRPIRRLPREGGVSPSRTTEVSLKQQRSSSWQRCWVFRTRRKERARVSLDDEEGGVVSLWPCPFREEPHPSLDDVRTIPSCCCGIAIATGIRRDLDADRSLVPI